MGNLVFNMRYSCNSCYGQTEKGEKSRQQRKQKRIVCLDEKGDEKNVEIYLLDIHWILCDSF